MQVVYACRTGGSTTLRCCSDIGSTMTSSVRSLTNKSSFMFLGKRASLPCAARVGAGDELDADRIQRAVVSESDAGNRRGAAGEAVEAQGARTESGKAAGTVRNSACQWRSYQSAPLLRTDNKLVPRPQLGRGKGREESCEGSVYY